MATLRLHVDTLDPSCLQDPRHPAFGAVARAAGILRSGGTVAFSTETVYGLGANALDASAVEKIFVAKQRPSWDPLIVHIADFAMLERITERVPKPARRWMERFWPGPLTLLLPRSALVPDLVTAGRERVGVRMPNHPVALALLRAAGVPIAAPSANLFGHVSPTTATHVLADLDGRIDAVLDAGPTKHGVESTVVDACEDPCLLYRPGTLTLEELASVWPRVTLYQVGENGARRQAGQDADIEAVQEARQELWSLPSPGVGLRHYAPKARLLLVGQGTLGAEELGQELVRVLQAPGERPTGVLLPSGLLSETQRQLLPPDLTFFDWGNWSKPDELASRLFAGLRALDAAGMKRIVCPLPADQGIGAALCDRLRKAAMPAR